MVLSYNLAYQEINSVHPTRRQILAGKPYSTFWNIWEWVIYRHICLMIHQKTHQTNPMAPGDPLDIPNDPLRPHEGPPQPLWTTKHAPWSHWTLKITCSALLFIRGPPVMIIIYHHIILPLDFCTVYPRSSSGVRRFYVELSANISRTKFASGLTGS